MTDEPEAQEEAKLDTQNAPAEQPCSGGFIETSRQDGAIGLRTSFDLRPDTLTHISITVNTQTAEHNVDIRCTALPTADQPQPAPQPTTAPLAAPTADEAQPAALPSSASDPPATADKAEAGMFSWGHLARLALVVGALLLALLGQDSFQQKHEFTWNGFFFFLGAILLFVLAATDMTHVRQGFDGALAYLKEQLARHGYSHLLLRHRWRIGALLLAVGLSSFHLYLLQRHLPNYNYNWTLLIWLAAIGLYLAAIRPPGALRLPRPDWRGWWSQHRQMALLVGGIVLVALVLRVWQLGSLPETLSGDEGSQGIEAMRVLDGSIRNPFTTGWLGVPTMSFYFNALSIGPLGNTIFAIRLPWAILGTLTVLVTFFLVRRLCGYPMGLLTAALLATYHYHIHYSRLGSNQVADALFVVLALLFFYRGYDQRRPLDWALCGVVVGVAQFFYAGARFTAVIIIALLIFYTLRDGILRFWRERYREVLVLTGAMLISSAPMIQYAIRFPDNYNARLNQVGIVQSGWLQYEMDNRGSGAFPILLDQFQRAALAFNAYPDRTPWYGSTEPLLDFTAAALFLIGLGYGALHLFDRRLFPMVAWWGGAIIMGGMLTESPPSSQRLITVAVPTMFFVALTLWKIAQMLRPALPFSTLRQVVPVFLSTAVLALSLVSIHRYFVVYSPERIYGSLNAVVSTELGKFARDELGPEWRIYFFGLPRMYAGFSSLPYLAPEVEAIDGRAPLEEPINYDLIRADKHAAFVFLPERADDLQEIMAQFPGGEMAAFPSPEERQPLFTIYLVPREEIAAHLDE